jgi:cytochrome oxidase Cu insertion factor (SCO1/SenC/PrrC family)
MKTKLLLSLAAALVVACAPVIRAAATVGEPAPDFTLTDVAGRSHSLAALKGRTVVLEWTNPECPFVKKHYESGNLPELQKAATADGVVWLSINSGGPGQQGDYEKAQVERWQQATGAAATAYLRDRDGTVGHLYGARTTPHLFIIDPQGTLVYAGAIDSIRSADKADIARATNYVKTTLTAMRENRPVTPFATQPYGCSVHY